MNLKYIFFIASCIFLNTIAEAQTKVTPQEIAKEKAGILYTELNFNKEQFDKAYSILLEYEQKVQQISPVNEANITAHKEYLEKITQLEVFYNQKLNEIFNEKQKEIYRKQKEKIPQ